MDELYKEFYNPTGEFKTEPRYFCYDLATELIDTAKRLVLKTGIKTKIQSKDSIAFVHMEFCSQRNKKLDFENVGNTLQECNQELKELERYSIENINDNNDKIDEKIEGISEKSFFYEESYRMAA